MNTDTKEREFLKLVHDNQNIIHKVCFAYCSNQAARDDLYQEITLQLWKSFDSFRGQSSFSTWMYRVALNTAINMVKKPNLFVDTTTTKEIYVDNSADSELSEDIRLLRKAISYLGKVEKAITLLWLDEKSYDEIAEAVGISAKNVSVKLVRTKKKLAAIMEKLQ